jgi:CBS-domain-containing membrane protein
MKIVYRYFGKMKGESAAPPRESFESMLWSFLGSFIGIAAVALLHFNFLSDKALVLVIGSFGASAVLIYGAVESPLAQPRNLIGGHLISAFIGVTCYKLFPESMWLASALAVSLSIFFMHFTITLHPPGGATALIAVIGGESIYSLGYKYILLPAGTGAMIMLIIALLVNNLSKSRKYPYFWM